MTTAASSDVREPGRASSAASAAQRFACADIEGIVLAGVHAWRDDAFERASNRPTLSVASRPLVWHAMEWLRRNGVASARLCGNGETRAIERSLASFPITDLNVRYHRDPIPRGPAGCVRDAAVESDAQAFVVVEGSIIPRLELGPVLKTHVESEAALTVAVSDGARSRGSVDPIGVYVLSKSALSLIPEHGYQDIKESLIPALYRRGLQVVTHACRGTASWRVADASSYLSVNMRVLEELVRSTAPLNGFSRRGDAFCHAASSVHESATLVGPVLVGERTRIEAGAVVVGPTSFGAGCVVERDAVVTRSAVWDGAIVGSGAFVDGCVLTSDSAVEPGSVARCAVRAPRRRRGVRGWMTRWLGGAEVERDVRARRGGRPN